MRDHASERGRLRRLQRRPSSRRLPASPPLESPIRLFIADKHEVIRAGIRALLQGEKSIKVVGEVGNRDELFTEIQRTKPHVVLLECGQTGGSTVDVCKRLFAARPSIGVIIVESNHGNDEAPKVLEFGALAFLPRNSSGAELIQRVHAVSKAKPYPGPEATTEILHLLQQERKAEGIHSMLQVLSPQERRIVALIADGDTDKAIAAKLQLSWRTVRNYVSNIFSKLEIRRRTQAAALYFSAERPRTPIDKKIYTQ
ncbi:MAG: response regulator transcription factor [Nitrospira sp.]